MKDMVLNIVRMVVDRPEDVRVTAFQGAATALIEVRCHPDDIGKVVGKDGKTVGAIRTLLNVVAARRQRRAILEVVE